MKPPAMEKPCRLGVPAEPRPHELADTSGTRLPALARPRRVVIWAALVLAASLAFLLPDLTRYPVLMWDESRLAVNALEMALNGPSLVTTFGFEADLWNTKPPLQIWLMALSLSQVAHPELALRLPSALAALAAVLLTFYFTHRFTRSPLAAAMAALLLLASRGFYGTHVARTGDYDALLVLITTAYCGLLFLLLHGPRPNARLFQAVGLLLALAVLTKGVGGLMPTAGVVVYAVMRRRWGRLFVWPSTLKAALIFLGLLLSFYVSREFVSPGYWAAVLRNEFGRYVTDLDPESDATRRGFIYLFQIVTVNRHFALGLLLALLLPAGWLVATPRRKLVLSYLLTVSLTFLVVVSLSRTRYPWYIAPVYPPLAMAAAISMAAILEYLERRHGKHKPALRRTGTALTLVLLLGAGGMALFDRHVRLVNYRDGYESSYGPFLSELTGAGHHTITVIDGGRADAGPILNAHYNPVLHFYQHYLGWRTGASVHVLHAVPKSPSSGTILATCDARINLPAGRPTGSSLGTCSAVLIP